MKTVYIAVAAGPGFLINYIGVSLLNLPKAGYVLLGAQIIAVILTGVIVGHTVRSDPLPHIGTRRDIKGNLLVNAVESASRSAFHMCAMVVVFSALIEVINVIITDESVCDILSGFIEITNGCNRIAGSYPLWLTAFFVGFGGLSVHFQIYATVGELPVRKGLFFLFRIIEGIIMMTATYIYLMFTPMTVEVFSSVEEIPTAARSATLAGSAALVLSALFFIGSVNKKAKAQQPRR